MMKMNEKGATMIEALAVIAIVAVLSISGMKLIGSLFRMFKQYAVTNEIKDVYKGIHDRFAAQGDYSELADMTAEDMMNEKLVPSQMYVSKEGGEKALFHRLGGEVVIEAVGDIYFQVEFKKLTAQSCNELLQLSWINGGASDLLALSVYKEEEGANGVTFMLPALNNIVEGFKGESKNFPITGTDAATYCRDDINIIWLFQ